MEEEKDRTRPILYKLKDSKLYEGYVNPHLLAQLHDYGVEINLKICRNYFVVYHLLVY